MLGLICVKASKSLALMMTKRFPTYWDWCLRCREQGLDEVADSIHAIMSDNTTMSVALEQILTKDYVVDCKDVANAALNNVRKEK
jgi:hypothetical protein